jgi:CheY-like chemotaxis protein
MVYGMVKGHGGYVEVASAPGRGTTFTLHLPAQAEAPAPLAEAAAPAPAAATVSLQGLRALVVDDESDLRRIVQMLLERAGAQVEVAVDGEEGWQRYREAGPFDLVVSDLRMPRASGMDLFLRIREAAPAQPFLLMSGFGLEEAVAQLGEDRFVGALAKPFRSAEFLEAAARLLGRAKGAA